MSSRLTRAQIEKAIGTGHSIIWRNEDGEEKIFQTSRDYHEQIDETNQSGDANQSNPLMEFLAGKQLETDHNQDNQESSVESVQESGPRGERDFEGEIRELEKKLEKLEYENSELRRSFASEMIQRRYKQWRAARKDIS